MNLPIQSTKSDLEVHVTTALQSQYAANMLRHAANKVNIAATDRAGEWTDINLMHAFRILDALSRMLGAEASLKRWLMVKPKQLRNFAMKGHFGFTGTQHGLTICQHDRLRAVLKEALAAGYEIGHHGDCIGADKAFHFEALLLGMRIIIHPPIDGRKRALCQGYTEIRSMKPYLQRNHDIVDESEHVIGTPHQNMEVLRSGTWATLRYAQRTGKKITIIQPDGIVRTWL